MAFFQKKSQESSRLRLFGEGQRRERGESWVRAVEHTVLRFGSFVVSLVSAHSIRWFLSPLDTVDPLQPVMNWLVAGCVGMFGYFLTRGLAHRMMNKESVRSYLPLVLVIEFVEVFCNFAEALSHLSRASWLSAVVPGWQFVVMMSLALVVYSCIPLISAFLAVVDMDLERKKLASASVSAQPKSSVSSPPLYVPPRTQSQSAASWSPTAQNGSSPSSGYSANGGGVTKKDRRAGGTNAAVPFVTAEASTTEALV